MVIGMGSADRYLTCEEIRSTVMQGICSLDLRGRRVLVIIPDSTRSMPMPMMFNFLKAYLEKKVKALDYLVALGTHSLMNDDQLSELVGRKVHHRRTGATRVINHEWQDPLTFIQIGTIPAEEIRKITGGLMSQDVPVNLNKLIFDYDHLLICGPVFPHEVVGFSGGNKYFFPGIAGPEIINFTHWLGAS